MRRGKAGPGSTPVRVVRRDPLLAIGTLGLALALDLPACGRSNPPPVAGTSPAPWTVQTPLPAVLAAPPAEVTAAIRALLAQGAPAPAPSAPEQASLAALYQSSFEPLLWVDDSFRPSASARVALRAMAGAAADGLEPEDYQAESLEALGSTLEASSSPSPRDVAAFDVGVSLSLMRYLRHLHRGRVDPRDIGYLLSIPGDEHDYAALVRDAALQARVEETIRDVTPPLVQYRLLRSMLARYRRLAAREVEFPVPPLGPTTLKPGDTAPGLDRLSTRLAALGDLAESATTGGAAAYEGEIVLGIKRFQTRHGLEADGVLGKTTRVALGVPLRVRLRQIELAMERMRWLPHLGERAFVAVNIPMFRLWGWDHVPETGAPAFEMGVIVGKALNTRTPVFVEEMEYLIFRPYWNVPRSILQTEILPLLRRDLSGYLDRQDMEMVDGQSDDARPVAPTTDNLSRLARGELRLRQRPGSKNALGDVKFIFPNDENVYLHSTPAPALFGRARRDFSHGCVRVEDPVSLAAWALQDQPEWTRERIVAAMKGRPSLRVPLTRPIRVVLYYVTAAVMPGDGSIHFAEDIYGQDPRLDSALIARRTKS